MKNNIWTEKVFTGPRYGGGVAMTLGLMLLVIKLTSCEDLLYTSGATFFVLGIILWFYSGYRNKKDTPADDILPPSTKNTAATGNKANNER